MTIPNTTVERIETALKKFDNKLRDKSEWQGWINKKSHKFAILWWDQIYPVKEIIRLATGFNSFSGGDGSSAANPYIRNLGFEIVSLDEGYRNSEQTTKRNPAWHRDELILALELYFRHHPTSISKNHLEVIKLSEILNKLPLHLDKPDVERFRNPNGVYMKLGNFLRFDPTYQGKGLTSGGKLEEVIWNEFAENKEKLKRAAEIIKMSAEINDTDTNFEENLLSAVIQKFNDERSRKGERELENSLLEMTDEQFNEYISGLDSNAGLEVRQGLVKVRKYNKKIIDDLKERSNHSCQICGFSGKEEYGESVVEAHHIEEFSLTQNNKPDNILIVCPNHHRLIHKSNGKFDKGQLIVTYANGKIESLKIKSHF